MLQFVYTKGQNFELTFQKWFDLWIKYKCEYILDNDLIQWVKFVEDLKMSSFFLNSCLVQFYLQICLPLHSV